MALSEADKKEIRAIAQLEAVTVAFSLVDLAEEGTSYGEFKAGLRAAVEGTRGLDMTEEETDALASAQAPPAATRATKS